MTDDVIDATKFKVARMHPPGSEPIKVVDIKGVDLEGKTCDIDISKCPKRIVLAFLSRGCQSCVRIWSEAVEGVKMLPEDSMFAVVTKDLDFEEHQGDGDPGQGQVLVICSTKAWHDYQVPGNSHIVIIDTELEKVVEESGALNWAQVMSLI